MKGIKIIALTDKGTDVITRFGRKSVLDRFVLKKLTESHGIISNDPMTLQLILPKSVREALLRDKKGKARAYVIGEFRKLFEKQGADAEDYRIEIIERKGEG